MQYTTNYNLKKPDGTDNFDIANENSNMDTIDAQMKANANAAVAAQSTANAAIPSTQKGVANGVASLDGTGNIPSNQLGNVPPVNAATTAAKGTVKVAAAPSSGDPIANNRVASVSEVQITGTSAQQIATYTPGALGNFLVYVYFRVVTGTTNVTITVAYTDASGAQTNTMLNAQASAVGSYCLVPLFINATAAAISVSVTASVANQVYASSSIVGV